MATQVFASFALAYLMSYALRAVNAVVAPALMAEFGLTNAQLGSLTSAYFLGFALLQLPLGVWLDRYGSRRTHAVLLLIATIGAAVYAGAASVEALWIGRALIGAGVAGALMAALKAYRFWFPEARQQQLVAWMLVAGSSGALASTVPVEMLLPIVGWRTVFWGCAAILALAAAAVYYGLPRDEERNSAALVASRKGESVWAGYRVVFGASRFWRFGIVSVMLHSGFIALQSLWAGPWLNQVVGLSTAQTAQVLFAFNLVLMVGFMVLGAVVARVQAAGWRIEWIMLGCCVVMVVSELGIALQASSTAWVWWLVLAAASVPLTMVQTHVSTTFDLQYTGRAYTAYNLLLFAGIFVEQWLFGVMIDVFKRGGTGGPEAFRLAMLWFVAAQVAALVAFVVWTRLEKPSAVLQKVG
jgi:MFS family permease